jgi:hypothetical protein
VPCQRYWGRCGYLWEVLITLVIESTFGSFRLHIDLQDTVFRFCFEKSHAFSTMYWGLWPHLLISDSVHNIQG